MILLIDCAAGASGDMLLAAMLDLGLPLKVLRRALRQVGLGTIPLRLERVSREGVQASRLAIGRPASRAPHRHAHGRRAGEMIRHIRESALPPALKRPVARVFTVLAKGEAAAHSVSPGKVLFHQLAGADTLVSIAGFCAGLRHFGIRAVHTTVLPVGTWHLDPHGRWHSHPGPATVSILRRFPLRIVNEKFEWTTPTAAAILAGLATPIAAPPLRISAIGHAVGHRFPPRGPTVLRALLGRMIA